jgi:hypothetical protein
MFLAKLPMAVVSGLLIISTLQSANAAEPKQDQIATEKQTVIKEVLEASRATRNAQLGYDVVIAQAVKGMNTALELKIDQDPKLSPEEKTQAKSALVSQLDKRMARFKQLSSEKINLPQLVTDIYLKLYDKYFTQQELQVMLDFYKSSTGQHVLDVFPQLTGEATQMVNAVAIPRIREVAVQFDQEIKDGKI